MTIESVDKDVHELLARMDDIAGRNGEYLRSIENRVIDGSVDVNDILNKLSDYIRDCDAIHDEIDEYIQAVMKNLEPTNEAISILYIISNLKSMNENSKKRLENFKFMIVPALVTLKQIGY